MLSRKKALLTFLIASTILSSIISACGSSSQPAMNQQGSGVRTDQTERPANQVSYSIDDRYVGYYKKASPAGVGYVDGFFQLNVDGNCSVSLKSVEYTGKCRVEGNKLVEDWDNYSPSHMEDDISVSGNQIVISDNNGQRFVKQ